MNGILITEELLSLLPIFMRGFAAANQAHSAGQSLGAILQATIDAMASNQPNQPNQPTA